MQSSFFLYINIYFLNYFTDNKGHEYLIFVPLERDLEFIFLIKQCEPGTWPGSHCNSSDAPFAKSHLWCFPAATHQSLLIIGCSAHDLCDSQIHASMICQSYKSWLNCYIILRIRFFNLCNRSLLHRYTTVLVITKLNNNCIVCNINYYTVKTT